MNAALSGAVALLLWQLAAPAQDATIRGRVFDPDGRPMQDVSVIAEMVDTERRLTAGRPGRSNAEGAFEITGLSAGRMLLRAEPRVTIGNVNGQSVRSPRVQYPPAFFPGVLDRLEAWPIEVKPGEIIELDFHMPPVFIGSIKTIVSGPDGYTLDHVRVIRPEANQIKNVRIEDGVGHADSLREGRYVASARGRTRDSLLAAYEVVHMTGGEVTVSLSLEPTATVHGRVIGERGGLPPVANTRVVAAWTDGTIDLDPLARDEGPVGPDGSFTIDGLFGRRIFRVAGLPADWQVNAIRQGRSDITSSGVELAPESANEISIVVAQQRRDMPFPEPPPLNPGTASIHGRVSDALTGKPVEGAEVRLVDYASVEEIRNSKVWTRSSARANKTLTVSDGSYAFDGIKDGAYRLFATHRMYLLQCSTPVVVPRSQCDVIMVVPDQRISDANVSLPPGAIIRGRVLDKQGHPIEGARLRAEFEQPLANPGAGGSPTSDADGRFEMTSVSPGQMLVLVDPPGTPGAWHRAMYYPGVHTRDEALPVKAEVGGPVEIEIREREIPVATIRATVSGPDGFQVQQMTLVNPDTRLLVNMKVADDGAASAAELDEGRYVISATATAGSDTLAAYQVIAVGTGEYEVPMLLEPTATVTGHVVVDRGGVAPVDGVFVEAHWVSDDLKLDLAGPERVSPGPDGSFTMRGLYGRRQFQLFGLSDEWRVTAVRVGRSDVTSGIDLVPGSSTVITIVVAPR